MSRYFLDANIIIRFLTGEPHDQASYTHAIFDSIEHKSCFACVNTLVLSEVYFALVKLYKFNAKKVTDLLIEIIKMDNLDVIDMSKLEILRVLKVTKEKDIDFPDCVYAHIAKKNKYKMISFDKDFKKLGINPVVLLD